MKAWFVFLLLASILCTAGCPNNFKSSEAAKTTLRNSNIQLLTTNKIVKAEYTTAGIVILTLDNGFILVLKPIAYDSYHSYIDVEIRVNKSDKSCTNEN